MTAALKSRSSCLVVKNVAVQGLWLHMDGLFGDERASFVVLDSHEMNARKYTNIHAKVG
jgi:hypothetical protein